MHIFTLIGIGYGFATFVAMSQTSMYFSSLRPLANGVVTSGASVLSIIFPYLIRDLMEKYGWRGSFLITGAISLNMSVLGSLIRPISAISDQSKGWKSADGEMYEKDFTRNDEPHLNESTNLRKLEKNTTVTTQKNKSGSFISFMRQYSLAFALLFVNFLFALGMYTPNVFIIPYAVELGFTELESTLLLSFISVGDFLGRLGSGLIASKLNFSLNCSLLVISFCTLLQAVLQLAPLFHPTFPVLMMYVTIYGTAFGGYIALSVSVIGQSMNAKNVEIAIATFLSSHGIAVLVGGPIAGELLCKVQHESCFASEKRSFQRCLPYFRCHCGQLWRFPSCLLVHVYIRIAIRQHGFLFFIPRATAWIFDSRRLIQSFADGIAKICN